MKEDIEFEILQRLTKIETNQNMFSRIMQDHLKTYDDRLQNVEHAIYGNGGPGLNEEVRNIKGWWGITAGGIVVIISAVINAAALKFIK